MCSLFSALEVMEASAETDLNSPRGSRRRNALPDLLTGLDEGAVHRLRNMYRESVAREGDGSATSQVDLEDDGAGASSGLPEPQPLDRLDIMQSPRYTRRRNAVPDLAAQLGIVDLRNNHHCYELDDVDGL